MYAHITEKKIKNREGGIGPFKVQMIYQQGLHLVHKYIMNILLIYTLNITLQIPVVRSIEVRRY